MDDKGVTGAGGVLAAAVLMPVVGFCVTGTSAAIPPGSNTTGLLEKYVSIAFASGQLVTNWRRTEQGVELSYAMVRSGTVAYWRKYDPGWRLYRR